MSDRSRVSRRRLGFVALLLAVLAQFTLFAAGGAGATNGVTLGSLTLRHNYPGSSPSYDYNVSALKVGNTLRFWWCGGGANPNYPTSSAVYDNTYYAAYDATTFAQITAPTSVFSEPTPVSRWDSGYVCNPTVVTGTFHPGIPAGSFNHAMYYVGTTCLSCVNYIGVAFSADGVNWVPYGTHLSLSAPTITSNCNYGLGNPSIINMNGHSVRLFYEDWCAAKIYTATSPDGVNFTTPVEVSQSGISVANDDLGGQTTTFSVSYDTVDNQWVLFDNRGRQRHPVSGSGEQGDLGYGVFTMPGTSVDSVPSGTWTMVHQVDTNLTGYEINQYGSPLRNQYGSLDSSLNNWPNLTVYYTAGDRLPTDVTDSYAWANATHDTWDIKPIVLSLDPNLTTPLERYRGATHDVTTGYVNATTFSVDEGSLGNIYEAYHAGTVQLFNCQVGGTNNYFVSTDPGCEGQRFIGSEGFALAAVGGSGSHALYRCRNGSTDHFVSTHTDCEGTTVESVLGYSVS